MVTFIIVVLALLELFAGADHGVSYLADPKRYAFLVEDFSRRVLLEGRELLRL